MAFWAIASPLIGTALAAGASAYSANRAEAGQEDANAINYKIAKENREFQERMRNTAHQAEVQDLKAAGLNPVLSAGGGGAVSPMGASASMQNTKAEAMNILASTAREISQTRLNTQLAQNEKQKEEQIVQTNKIIAERAKQEITATAKAQNELRVEKSWYGRNVLPWVERTVSAIGKVFGGGVTATKQLGN